ncbi:MAG: AAA family ATPase [Nitrososphaerales archaeon]|nr:AAA family ATPase [Nitrososphaerales archaeon]
MPSELSFERLRLECDPASVRCETTEDMTPLTGIVGQKRAVRALKFGLEIKDRGFNIYVSGFPGTGRTTVVKDFLEEKAKGEPIPHDWCYVNNFHDPYQPKGLKLPSGKGKEFREDMKNFVENARRATLRAFESEDYAKKREETIKSIKEEGSRLMIELNVKAQREGFFLQSTPMGLFVIPIIKDKPLSEQEFMALSPQLREEIQKRREGLDAELRNAMRQHREIDKKLNEEIQKLDREVILYAIGQLVADLKTKYKGFLEIATYLEDIQDDILKNIALFRGEQEARPSAPFPLQWAEEPSFRKYEVNLIVDNSSLNGAPVIIELNPTHQNLFGRIEKEARFGALTTDFTMIKSGSLHKANGGYLVIPIEDLLQNPFSYDSLKRSIKNEQIAIEEIGERMGFVAVKSLKPEPIPLKVKIVLIGSPILYQYLYSLDMEFNELFKVKADFDTTMDRTEENMQSYASFICTLCQKEGLKHLESSAVAKIVEHGSRLAEDQKKLSTRFAEIANIIREASFYASQEGSRYVTANHVKKTIEEKIYRSNLIQEKIRDMIERNILLISTTGEAVGQVNSLSVISLGDLTFGVPSRVTVSIGLGREGIVDIQREAQLGGRIHTKGVMILGGYLAEKYAHDKPLTLSARLVFEQSYDIVEGDSASSTELYAILSSLSGFPIKQSIAVTGSVNQKGEVQAIGGVNEKIEGFFEVCKAKVFTGQQGVIIPESNVQNLMLKEEIIEAVKGGSFHIYPVRTIDQGIEILTGAKAGSRRMDGTFEKGSINDRVDMSLKNMVDRLKEFPEFLVGKGK